MARRRRRSLSGTPLFSPGFKRLFKQRTITLILGSRKRLCGMLPLGADQCYKKGAKVCVHAQFGGGRGAASRSSKGWRCAKSVREAAALAVRALPRGHY